MRDVFLGGLGRALRGVTAGVRTRAGVFTAVALTVLAMDVVLPPVVLSLARKPVDYVTFNPWLVKFPEYLAHGPGPLGERLGKVWGLALFWCSADSPYGIEWGFAVTVGDLARFLAMSALVGSYFALWVHRRGSSRAFGAGGHVGLLGAMWSVFGLATGGCTVMGCGAPVIPVIGLAFAGLSSMALTWMSAVSAASTVAVTAGMALGVLYLGWSIDHAPASPKPRRS